jgi:NADH-quinone oxidoreductase subunit J
VTDVILAAEPLTRASTGETIQFWILAPLAALGALGMVFAHKAVHSALCLATTMIALAAFYIAEDALFLGVVQIVVYTGAVMMLFLFVLMLVGVDSAESLKETIRGQRLAAAAVGVGFGLLHSGGIAHGVQRDRRTGRADLPALRVGLRTHRRPADHRHHRRHGADPPRAVRAPYRSA